MRVQHWNQYATVIYVLYVIKLKCRWICLYHYLSIHYSGITFLIFPAVIFLLRSISFHLFFFYIYLGRMTFVNFMESQVNFFRFVFVFFCWYKVCRCMTLTLDRMEFIYYLELYICIIEICSQNMNVWSSSPKLYHCPRPDS